MLVTTLISNNCHKHEQFERSVRIQGKYLGAAPCTERGCGRLFKYTHPMIASCIFQWPILIRSAKVPFIHVQCFNAHYSPSLSQ